jgi:hypothetical protein
MHLHASVARKRGKRRSVSEPVLKGAQTSYKVRGRKQKQEELFPDLLAEIEKRRKEREKGAHYTAEERFGTEFRKELVKVSMERIGGTEAEKREFFDKVIAKYPDVDWIEGCPAPTVRSKLIHFNLKPGAVPKARQPIPLSPYDDLRVEFHIEENIAEGKLRRVEPEKGEKLPEGATPVFVVDQDAKGLLGRLVCAYGVVNAAMELPTFPSADPQGAFDMAAGKRHHTLVDAIWGYTQFLLDEPTRKLLVICTRSGLYEWLRMPFGPAPAPAEMQSYVANRFGSLRNRRGEEFVSPCMDDIKISSATFEEHVEEVNLLNEEARREGFEFKLKKGQFNQPSIEFWGCILDGEGRRPQPKKIEQLKNWPEPVDQAAVNSFLCFVN